MRRLTCSPLFFLLAALLFVVIAYRQAPELPEVLDEESFLPRTEAVQWMALGHRSTAASLLWINGLVAYGEGLLTGKNFRWITHLADASTRLDSLFKTPYTFVAAITPTSESDTSDYAVLRRGIAKYPEDWQMAVSFALRLAEGPSKDYKQAAQVMEVFANDTTVLPHIRTLHQSFALRTQTTEIALMSILSDCTDPRYTGYRSSLAAKAARALYAKPGPEQRQKVWLIMEPLFQGREEVGSIYNKLLSLKATPD